MGYGLWRLGHGGCRLICCRQFRPRSANGLAAVEGVLNRNVIRPIACRYLARGQPMASRPQDHPALRSSPSSINRPEYITPNSTRSDTKSGVTQNARAIETASARHLVSKRILLHGQFTPSGPRTTAPNCVVGNRLTNCFLALTGLCRVVRPACSSRSVFILRLGTAATPRCGSGFGRLCLGETRQWRHGRYYTSGQWHSHFARDTVMGSNRYVA